MANACMRQFWRTEAVFFLPLWLFLWQILAGKAFLDPGSLWHSAVGDYMLRTGRLIEQDPFSFTFGGKPWLPHQWLAELIEAAVFRLAGWDGLLLAAVALLAWLYAWVAGRFAQSGCHWLVTAPLLLAAIMASQFHFVLRPHLITIALLGWTVGKLCDVDAGRAPVRSLWWLVPIYILWTNMHGGMLGGVATLTLAVLGWKAAHWLGWPTPLTNFRQYLEATLVVVVCALTMFVTPYGARLPQVWGTIMTAGLSDLIIEHMSLWKLWQDEGHRDMVIRASTAMLVIAAVYFVALLSQTERRPRITALLPIPWFVLGLTSVRHMPLFVITAMVLLAELLPHMRWASEGAWFATRPTSASRRIAAWLVPALLVLATFGVAMRWHRSRATNTERGGGFVELPGRAWPFDLLSELRGFGGREVRLFNQDVFGGFLMRFVPDMPVFIDDRCELYGNRALYYRNGRTFLAEYIDALTTHPEHLSAWTKEYGLNAALVQTGSNFDTYLRSPAAQADGWRLIKEITAAALFERKAGP